MELVENTLLPSCQANITGAGLVQVRTNRGLPSRSANIFFVDNVEYILNTVGKGTLENRIPDFNLIRLIQN